MATIHKRQTEWSPKVKKKPDSKAVSAVKGFLSTAWSGAKIIGKKVSDPEFQQKLGDFSRNAGRVSRQGFGYEPKKRKSPKKKDRVLYY